jgi:hypothetical protein
MNLDRGRLLDGLAVHPGLCATCEHLRLLASKRSVFARCGLADVDPRFVRYPPLPVRVCSGYLPVLETPGSASDPRNGD